MKTLLKTTAALVALAACSAPAHAAVLATLSFIQPTGSVASNQNIDVYLRLTLDSASDPLTTDASGTPTSGFNFAGYTGPIDLGDPNTRIFLNEAAECSGTLNPCGGGAYAFNFNFNQPNFIAPQNFDLQPGQSYDWLFGTFSPNGGNAPAGSYAFYNAGVHFQVYNPGADPFDGGDDQNDFINFGNTCTGQNPDCAFTRDVFAATSGVPEPGTWAMMLLGFGIAGSAMRRQTVRVSFA